MTDPNQYDDDTGNGNPPPKDPPLQGGHRAPAPAPIEPVDPQGGK